LIAFHPEIPLSILTFPFYYTSNRDIKQHFVTLSDFWEYDKNKRMLFYSMKDTVLEILFLSAAISVDAFAASFAYGCRRIKIPVFSVMILSTISVLFLSASLLAGTFLSSLIPAGLTTQISFLILFVLGLIKLFEPPSDTRTQNGDRNHDNLLSASEAFYLGLALSLDSLAAGIGAGMTPIQRPSYIFLTAGIALLTGIAAIFSGCFLGKALSARLNGNFCRLSGLILIALAFMKFF